MTEAEWLASADPLPMLAAGSPRLSDRRLRLFSARIADLALRHGSSLPGQRRAADGDEARLRSEATAVAAAAVRDLDRFADREVAAKRLRRALRGLRRLHPHWTTGVYMVLDLLSAAVESPPQVDALETWLRAAQNPVPLDQAAQLLRDILGNPFLPVAFDSRWRTADVVGLARGIYEDRAFDRLPLLADALMDAGCGEEQVLSHCRSEGPHVRGCWVVDLTLGKE